MAGHAIFLHDAGDYPLTDAGTLVALTATAIETTRRAGLGVKVLDDLTPRPEICRESRTLTSGGKWTGSIGLHRPPAHRSSLDAARS